MTDPSAIRKLIEGVTSLESSTMRACFCIGPQDGEPLCPCRMTNVKIVNGRYVETIDHGPARIAELEAGMGERK